MENSTAEERAKADEKYFAQRKAGPRPVVKAGDTEELISFVEDGLNRNAKAKPKPMLGQRRPAAKKGPTGPADLAARVLASLAPPTPNAVTGALRCLFDDSALMTELLVKILPTD